MNSISIRKILLIIAAAVFLFSGGMVAKYNLELHASEVYAGEIAQMAVTPNEEPTAATAKPASSPTAAAPAEPTAAPAAVQSTARPAAADATAVPAPSAAPAQPTSAPTDKPSGSAPVRVDFDVLRAKNPDVVAWLYSPDTPINYPVVQADDNEYYMHRLFDGRQSYPGTLFLDCRNSAGFSDWNSVIYGHNMRNDTMFGTLSKYGRKSYRDAHSRIYLFTPERSYVINVLAGFVTENDAELYNALRPDGETKERLLADWIASADVAPKSTPSAKSRFVTLSTCSSEYENARYVLIGTLSELSD